MTTYPTSEGDLPAYLAVPARPGPWPGVVVVQEAFGLTDDLRQSCDRLASLGYLAIAPRLFARGGRGPACLISTFKALSDGHGRAVEDLEDARRFLETHEGSTGRVGVLGFCLGGGFAMLLATRPGWAVAAPQYGQLPAELSALRQACPVVAGFGGRDRGLRGAAAKLTAELEAGGVAHDVREYPEAGHSFMNRDALGLAGPVLARLGLGYDHDAAEDSWRRITTFFDQHLAVPAAP